MPDDLAALQRARSMLIILLATCHETALALSAAANALDSDLERDLRTMIERTEAEIAALSAKITAATDS